MGEIYEQRRKNKSGRSTNADTKSHGHKKTDRISGDAKTGDAKNARKSHKTGDAAKDRKLEKPTNAESSARTRNALHDVTKTTAADSVGTLAVPVIFRVKM